MRLKKNSKAEKETMKDNIIHRILLYVKRQLSYKKRQRSERSIEKYVENLDIEIKIRAVRSQGRSYNGSLEDMIKELKEKQECTLWTKFRKEEEMLNHILEQYHFKNMLVRHKKTGKEGILQPFLICRREQDGPFTDVPVIVFFPLKDDGTLFDWEWEFPYLEFVRMSVKGVEAWASEYEPVRYVGLKLYLIKYWNDTIPVKKMRKKRNA